MTRETKRILCSCGGQVSEVETTEAEEQQYGCGRPGCCVEALQCDKCGTRFTLALDPPEME